MNVCMRVCVCETQTLLYIYIFLNVFACCVHQQFVGVIFDLDHPLVFLLH